MAIEPKVIDIEDEPALLRLVDEVSEGDWRIVLRRRGEDVALITALKPGSSGRGKRRPRADNEGFRSAFGGWTGLIDVDEWLKEVYADRELSSDRPPIEL